MANKRNTDKEQCFEMVALATHATNTSTLFSPLNTVLLPFLFKDVIRLYQKCFCGEFWWQISQVVKNAHDGIFILWQIKG